MNLGQIRTKARRKLDETNARFWSDDELNDYINETNRKIWQYCIDVTYRKCMTTADLNLTANQRTVTLPTDFIKDRLLEHKVGNVYYPCTYYERFDTAVGDNTVATASIGNYYSFAYSFLGDSIVLEPAPQNSETGTLRLTYLKAQTDLDSDSDEPEIPSLYHDLYVLGCVIQAKEKEEMIAGGGADSGPFVKDYNDLWLKFVNNISVQTVQRSFSEPFGVF